MRDDIVAALGNSSDRLGIVLRVDQLYALADDVITEVAKTDRLIDQGRIFRVIETDWIDGNEEPTP
jgi:hypothetical protein